MSDAQLLAAVKTDLGITAAAYDARLGEIILAAKQYIIREGAGTLDPSRSAGDAQLVVMYAAYLWRQRSDAQAPMPRMLRWALNNRVFGEKAGAAE